MCTDSIEKVHIGVDLDTTQPMIKPSRNTPLRFDLAHDMGHAKQQNTQLSGVVLCMASTTAKHHAVSIPDYDDN